MRNILIFGITLFSILFIIHQFITVTVFGEHPIQWEFQSVDTMKYSRDLAREKLSDDTFNNEINVQMEKIAGTGATHVAIATPYDDEFLPFLKRWVALARANHLHVWFRGNFSGWEGWFGYPKITREDHLHKTVTFIKTNKDIFENGDIFTPCPECENGGPGDPRDTQDIDSFREFQIEEYHATRDAFKQLNLKVTSNFASMNADVAKLVMDKQTTDAMGGIVVIDHYTPAPELLRRDIDALADQSGGKIVLGEFGAPIPNINGSMTDDEQASWLDKALRESVRSNALLGVNYWVGFGGSTAIWNDDGTPKKAAAILTQFYEGHAMALNLVDSDKNPIASGTIDIDNSKYLITNGVVSLPFVKNPTIVIIESPGFKKKTLMLTNDLSDRSIVLEKEKSSWLLTIQKLLSKLNSLMTIEIKTK